MGSSLAIIMAGGVGARLWPASTHTVPKHLVPGLSPTGATLLAATVERLAPLVPLRDVRIVTTEDQADAIVRAIPGLLPTQILREPAGKNTAPCLALAVASLAAQTADDPTLYILPADHHVRDGAAFRAALTRAGALATARDTICTLGITPTGPHTGFGYLEFDPTPLDGSTTPLPGHAVRRFTEKPDEATARSFLEGGAHLWNAGIFVSSLGRIARDLEARCGDIWAPIEAAVAAGDPAALVAAYDAVTPAPIDVALMEQLDDLCVVPCDAGWSDLGSWAALHAQLRDAQHPVRHTDNDGRIAAEDSDGSLIWADGTDVAVLGLPGVAVIAVDGRVLVCPLDRAEEIKRLVGSLKPR